MMDYLPHDKKDCKQGLWAGGLFLVFCLSCWLAESRTVIKLKGKLKTRSVMEINGIPGSKEIIFTNHQ